MDLAKYKAQYKGRWFWRRPVDMPLFSYLFENQALKIWRVRLVWWGYGTRGAQLQYYGKTYRILWKKKHII